MEQVAWTWMSGLRRTAYIFSIPGLLVAAMVVGSLISGDGRMETIYVASVLLACLGLAVWFRWHMRIQVSGSTVRVHVWERGRLSFERDAIDGFELEHSGQQMAVHATVNGELLLISGTVMDEESEVLADVLHRLQAWHRTR